MDCMKCGKKLGRSETFCDECIAKMEKSPVDQNAIVNLPQRPTAPIVKKKPKIRRYLWEIEGENDTLRTKIRWLRMALIVATLGFAAVLVMLFVLMFQTGRLDPLFSIFSF